MLVEVCEKLEAWLTEQATERDADGILPLGGAEIFVYGQTALIEAKLKLHLAQTMDVDAKVKANALVKEAFGKILKEYGRELDPDSHLVSMPQETQYDPFFRGRHLRVFLAKPEYVILSKAKFAPEKNRALVQEFLEKQATEEFLELAKNYDVDLEKFL